MAKADLPGALGRGGPVTANGLVYMGSGFLALALLARRWLHEDAFFTAMMTFGVLVLAGDIWMFVQAVRSGDTPVAVVEAGLTVVTLMVLWMYWQRWRKGKRKLRDALGAKSRALRDALVRKTRESAQPRPVRVPS